MRDLLRMFLGFALYAVPMGLLLASGPDKKKDDISVALALAQELQKQAPRPWLSPLPFPQGMEKFQPSKWTQSIAVSGNKDVIRRAPVSGTPSKWHQSGGMQGIKGVRSDKFKLLPEKPKEWIGDIWVWNGLHDSDGSNSSQQNRGLKREYVDGSRFDDLLSYKGRPFEHRMRVKLEGKWHNAIIWRDESARPPGYNGMKMACADCHNERNVFGDTGPGFGGYSTGLVPGGDTVISDSLPWHLVGRVEDAPQTEERRQFQQFQPGYGGSGFQGRGFRGRR